MKRLIQKYLTYLKITEQTYDDVKSLREKYLSNESALYIPKWNYLDKYELELISINHGLICRGTAHKSEMLFQDVIQTCSASIFDTLQEIEQILTDEVDSPRLLYLGLMAYESAHHLESITRSNSFYDLPDYYFIFPGNTLLIDHTQQQVVEFSVELGMGAFMGRHTPSFELPAPVISESKSDYLGKINTIRDLIAAGEVYQVNYTIRFSHAIGISGLDFFNRLYQLNPAPFSFYARLPGAEIISNSPERFCFLDQQKVVTQPIKGTIRRTDDAMLNQKLQQQLQGSEKDAAELSMIVDLLRNDISKVCQPGSLIVEKHKDLQAFSNVFHLISTISGKLQHHTSFIDLFKAVFPGGSITGCPKISAMKTIAELELHERSFYTGTFFLRFPAQQSMDSSILIRTALQQGQNIHFQAGGGIVIDSDPEAEYRECLAKAASFLKTVEDIS